jgi:hypothetical protein
LFGQFIVVDLVHEVIDESIAVFEMVELGVRLEVIGVVVQSELGLGLKELRRVFSV